MPVPAQRFDDFLPEIRADDLKSMVTLWGGKAAQRKDLCVAMIRRGLADPVQVRAAVQRLDPYEYAALALIKQAGGVIDGDMIGVALLAMGVPLPPRLFDRYTKISESILGALVKRGLVLADNDDNPTSLYRYGGYTFFTDARLLAAVEPVDATPFTIKPGLRPTSSTYRTAPAVALDIIGFLRAIDNLGGLGLTQKDAPRVNEVRKIQRELQWPDDALVVDGLAFRGAFDGLLSALHYSPWLTREGDVLRLTAPLHDIAALDYDELIAGVLDGFLDTGGWRESGKADGYDFYNKYFQQGRFVLTQGLKSLPTQVTGFFTIDDFDQAIYARVGEHFSLDYAPSRPYVPYNASPQEQKNIYEEWRHKLRTKWLASERVWLEQALTGWLYFLGLVEIGLEKHAPVSFRLTELGRAIFHPKLAPQPGTARTADAGQPPVATWVVQPNFELVVYLDRTTPSQLAFLERHAERTSAQQYIAHYRLTRESVYRGLESGATLDELLDGLRRGAHADLPQNVLVELREWAALRERITLMPREHLLELPDAAARDAVVATKLPGRPVGERYFLLQHAPAAVWEERLRGTALRRVDYAAQLPQCLSAGEDGVLTLDEGYTDLLIAAQLDQWAERIAPRQWGLTAARVAAAVRAGARLTDLTTFLAQRLHRALPPLLGVALRNWAGRPVAVAVAGVTVLRCEHAETLAAIKASKTLRRYIRGELAPDVLLIDTAQLAEFEAHLAWAGLRVDPLIHPTTPTAAPAPAR